MVLALPTDLDYKYKYSTRPYPTLEELQQQGGGKGGKEARGVEVLVLNHQGEVKSKGRKNLRERWGSPPTPT